MSQEVLIQSERLSQDATVVEVMHCIDEKVKVAHLDCQKYFVTILTLLLSISSDSIFMGSFDCACWLFHFLHLHILELLIDHTLNRLLLWTEIGAL